MSISKELLEEFSSYSPVFIETGTLNGENVKRAMSAGFNKAYSIELSEIMFKMARRNLQNVQNVTLINGDSGAELVKLLKNINKKCVFWLDAHYSGGDTAGHRQVPPLLKELNAIAQHHIKNHLILIDDVRIFKNAPNDLDVTKYARYRQSDSLSWANIMSGLYKINPEYKLRLETGFAENDILIATPGE
ncbi:hypothetical protein LCGC14_0413770 [marine sediment metagenome]|uniref:Methyltransferase domain-containing protein n=1 Tax=marine sediment metagenome TaxID=412755 RepID=A0A0F9ST45_9ZZZZ